MLATQASKDKDAAISICASEKAPLPSVSKVLDLCRKQGLTKFTLQTEQP
jgi:biopolymer transport protein ExbD